MSNHRNVKPPLSQQIWNAAPVDLVLGALTREWKTLDQICVRLGAGRGIYPSGITREGVFMALYRLAKASRIERSTSGVEGEDRSYRLMEGA